MLFVKCDINLLMLAARSLLPHSLANVSRLYLFPITFLLMCLDYCIVCCKLVIIFQEVKGYDIMMHRLILINFKSLGYIVEHRILP